MTNDDKKTLEFLVHTISKHAQFDLTVEQGNAVFAVARSLPKSSTLSDLEMVCLGGHGLSTDVPAEVIELLKPLALALGRNNSYAGRFAPLFDQHM